MITLKPPATWDGSSVVNPEKLNRNIGAARAQLTAWGDKRWVRNTVTHRMGTVSISTSPREWHLPVVSGLPYVVERITVYGDISGEGITLRWGMNSTFNSEVGTSIPLNPGTMATTSPSRGTALPGYAVPAGANWSDSFRISMSSPTIVTGTNIIIEVALRYDRQPTRDSDPYSPDLETYRTGDELTAERHNNVTSAIEVYAAGWVTGTAVFPSTMYYIQLQSVTAASLPNAITVPLPGSGNETVSRILARAELASAGAAGQTVTIGARYGTWGVDTTPTNVTLNVAGVTVATGAVTTLIQSTARDPAVAAKDLLISGATAGATTIQNIGIWLVRNKI